MLNYWFFGASPRNFLAKIGSVRDEIRGVAVIDGCTHGVFCGSIFAISPGICDHKINIPQGNNRSRMSSASAITGPRMCRLFMETLQVQYTSNGLGGITRLERFLEISCGQWLSRIEPDERSLITPSMNSRGMELFWLMWSTESPCSWNRHTTASIVSPISMI